VPIGAPLPSDRDVLWPGANETEEEEMFVDQPDGSFEPRFTVLEGHPEESLFVTETL